MQVSKNEIGVRDGRSGIPLTIARRSWRRACTAWSNPKRAARIKAVPATNRTTVHTNALEKLELFLAEPDRQFEPMKAGLTEGVQEFKKQNTTLLTQATAEDAPDWTQSTAPSIVVRPGVNLATPLPEGAADVLFSCAGRSYQLKLNNCVNLPGHGWVLGADIELIDLASQAEAEKAWTEDFPAAQLRATEQKKRLLVILTTFSLSFSYVFLC